MRKLRVSTKILITAAVVVGALYAGERVLSSAMLASTRFEAVAPKKVNLVAITPGAGYRIIIANDVAQLVETQGGFQGDKGDGAAGPTDGAIKRRVPIRELLGVLRGDGKALGPFVMIMNNIRENEDWSPHRVLWRKADIERAIGGDPKLKTKLEHDLSVRLDGTPVTPLRLNAMQDGIFLVTPVELTLKIDGKDTVVRGETMEPYKPSFVKAVEARYKDKSVDTAQIAGYYAAEAEELLKSPGRKENVAGTLRQMISKETMEGRLETPRRLLSNATVILNEDSMQGASYESRQTTDNHTLCDLSIDLDDLGRRRLWKFTKDRVGDQLLLIENDVAVAAPRIQHELALSRFTVTQMPDELLVRETVDTIKAAKKDGPR